MPYLESPLAAGSHDNRDPTLSLAWQHVVYIWSRMAVVTCVHACTDLVVIIMSRLNPVLGCALELHAVLLDILLP